MKKCIFTQKVRMKQNFYTEVQNWMYRNARPLELARYQYHFEGGSREAVLNCLTAYQNEDGGFGHALEADSWNPNSAPIQVFHATEILREIGWSDHEHPMIQGILGYLTSGKDMEGELWLSDIPSNNDYPHASWWEYHPAARNHNPYNPTIGLAGFGLCYGEKSSQFFEKCKRIAMEASKYLLQALEVDMHTLNCFIALAQYLEQAQIDDIVDLSALWLKLRGLVRKAITEDTDRWASSYVCKPSQFFRSADSIFYEDNKKLADFEVEFIKSSRNSQGVWDVTWNWEAYPQEWAISKNWWKAELVIKNLTYLNISKRD